MKNILLAAVLTESSGRVSNTCMVIKSNESAIISVPTKFLRITSLTASRCAGFILPVFDFKCIVLYPERYIEITFRCRELTLSFSDMLAVAALTKLEPLSARGIIDSELFASRMTLTGSPGFRFISCIHFFGNDKMYVDLPVNCILRTSPLLSDREINNL